MSYSVLNKLQNETGNLTKAQKAAVEALVAKKKRGATTPKATIPQIKTDPANKDKPFPLTDIQQAQWFGRSGLFDISVAGHGYVEFDCKGKDLERLEAAFQIIIDRNPQMRMVVLPDLKQQVLNDLPHYRFKRCDLRGASTDRVEQTLIDTRERMSHYIIPADTWPVYEVCATLWGENNLRIHFSFDLLVGDAWCFRMIIDEWARLYDNPSNVRPVPAELTYRDYVLGFEEIERSELFAQSLKYWQKQLIDLPPAPQLPMIRQPGELDEIRAKHYSIRLNGEEWSQLRWHIKRNNLTPSAFFAAAFSEVISLWNPISRHTLNVTVFNRLPVHKDINDILVGEFNSFLFLDVDNSQPESFAKRAARSQAKLWNHLENRWVTGVRLMRELTKVRGVNTGEALMPVVFTSTIAHHEGDTDIPTRYPGKLVYEVSQTPQVWMEHHLWEEDEQLSLHIDVVDGLFPEGLMENFVATYERLVRSLMGDPAAWEKPRAAHLLSKSYAALWAEYNDTAAPKPDGLLHEGFIAATKKHQDKVAVHSARGAKTYAELDDISNRLAHVLQDFGARPNELVAVIAPKGWEQIAAVLGIAKSGAAYLPIEADDPDERITRILTDAKVANVLTTVDTQGGLSLPVGVKAIAVDDPALYTLATTRPENPAKSKDIAYVIYTSGSTGKPKGVVIRHAAALNTIVDINQRFNVTSDDVIFAISALNFDLSVYDIFGGLAAGATLVMPASQMPEPLEWLSLSERYGVTVWNSVPALAEMFVTYAEETGRIVPESLRLAMLSGDWIPMTLPPMLKIVRPDMQIISLGGATEASIWSIYHPIAAISPEWKSIPYGRPLANQSVHVLNANLESCLPWATGEIYIGGVGLAEGYFEDPEKTAASFVTHPVTQERLYRTGDLGRMNPAGFIEFLGRKDTQVKLCGYRIELGEIEAAIASTDLAEQAVCLISGDSNDTRQLIAFVTMKGAQEKESFTAALTIALEKRLPDYMVPAVVSVLDEIPLTPNGKVDRQYIAPRNDTEERIAEMWKALLGVERVGVHDDFFALGGNSMIASRLIIQIQDVFEIELPFSKLFEAANVAALSELVITELMTEIEALEDCDPVEGVTIL
jgi:amino acid adenylation domain-containing protein